jgi:hypothetical protein
MFVGLRGLIRSASASAFILVYCTLTFKIKYRDPGHATSMLVAGNQAGKAYEQYLVDLLMIAYFSLRYRISVYSP